MCPYDLSSLVNRFRLTDILRKIGPFYTWNGELVHFERPHLLIQRVVDLHRNESDRDIPISMIRKMVEIARVEKRLNNREWLKTHADRLQDWASFELELMKEGLKGITNPGPPPAILNYAMDRYLPFNDLLRRRLGFTVEEACFSAMIFNLRIMKATGPFIDGDSPPKQRLYGPGRYTSTLLTPPTAFVDAYLDATVYSQGRNEQARIPPVAERVLEFLSCDPSGFSTRAKSFSRWAFVKLESGESGMLLSQMLAETLVSAIQLGLLEKLTEQEKGSFGERVGAQYEALVAAIFRKRYPKAAIRPRVKAKEGGGDADLIVELDSGFRILVMCKGKLLQAGARWGNQPYFLDNLQSNVVGGADQARRFIAASPDPRPIDAVFIVLDSYFPSVPLLGYVEGTLGNITHDLPLPVITTHYDLSYLLTKVSPNDLPSYLRWRDEALKSGKLRVADEFDIVRARLFTVSNPEINWQQMVGTLSFIGSDRDYSQTQYEELAARFQEWIERGRHTVAPG